MKKFVLISGLVLVGLSILVLSGIYVFNHLPISVECINCSDQGEVGPRGSMIFEFSRSVQPDLIESSWKTIPEIAGHFEWIDSKHVRWKSNAPLLPSQSLRAVISAGIASEKGEKIRKDAVWDLVVRQPNVLVLAATDGTGQEIFMLDPESSDHEMQQLTFTQGQIMDFTTSQDGEFIVFSSANDVSGYDLWVVNRDGSDFHKIMECAQDRCSSASISPTGEEIAYIREISHSDKSNGPSSSEVWLFSLADNSTEPLLEDSRNSGFSPNWSPDGVWLSFWNEDLAQILMTNMSSGQVLSLDSSNGNTGCWSENSRILYYPDLSFNQAEFRNVIQQVDLDEGTIRTIIGTKYDEEWLSYDNPACNPINTLISVTVQPNIKIPGRTLSVIDVETGEKFSIIDDLTSIPGYISWSPAGDQLLFQLTSFDQDQDASIWIWDKQSNLVSKLVDNAQSPMWLP
jgi:hypothetical protein